MEVYLIRHTAVQAAGLCYGHCDVPLADTFAAEAAQVQAKLASLAPAPPTGYRAFSSPAQRCLALAETLSTAITPDERLREMHFGTWENRLWSALPAAETTPWMDDYVTLAPPQGETFGAVQQRAAAFLTELVSADLGSWPVVMVTHGGTIRALVCHCLQIPLQNAFQLGVDYGSITRLKWQYDCWQLLGLNG
ncbi:alpha-ribazole phosphatase family protein [Hymenobacter sp. GOD-10R]|uniref:histidine phosphatase family protein n=1 Tax=Hymenobacter sp. GOD-10R TaxID=3093922 RepID=UPI002D7775D6|nr:alpha-ribazole phosphatase family protein [Hymenobacter sp. GOD-10R]WRQ28503.1 alpha-ribazole phosphatase family protein [Hymenobacter sp. GOD-10R]